MRLLDQGWFFISNAPNVICSRTFNGSYPAFASWAKFATTTGGAAFHVINFHFESKNRSNRIKSVTLVADRIAPRITAGTSAILFCDINILAGSQTAQILGQTKVRFLPVAGATFYPNHWINLFGAIGQISRTDPPRALGDPVVLRQRFLGLRPSDHSPVLADILMTD